MYKPISLTYISWSSWGPQEIFFVSVSLFVLFGFALFFWGGSQGGERVNYNRHCFLELQMKGGMDMKPTSQFQPMQVKQDLEICKSDWALRTYTMTKTVYRAQHDLKFGLQLLHRD